MFTDFNNLGEKENESISPPRPFQPIIPRPDKETEDARSAKVSLPSHISIEPADTLDYSNCATSPSKSTMGYVSSIPGTIYYEGMNSVTRPHIENARVVSESELFVEDRPMPPKVRPARISSDNSSVPRMNWSPPQPLAGNNNETQSSRPKYVARPYASSALQGNIIPAVPIEEITMDGLTDNGRSPGVDKSPCDKAKGYKSLLLLTALIVILAISAVVFSIIYVTAIDADDAEGREDEISTEAGNECHPDCYDPFQPKVVCGCECYTKKDNKYYTCGERFYLPNSGQIEDMYNSTSESADTDNDLDTDFDTDTDNTDTDNTDTDNTDTDKNTDTDIDMIDINIGTDTDTDTDTSIVFEDDYFTDIKTAYAGDDDDVKIDYDDVWTDDDNEINIMNNRADSSCPKMCYRKNIHPRWNPEICHRDCYCNTDKCFGFKRRYFTWKEWRKLLDDDRLYDDTLDFTIVTGHDDDGDDDDGDDDSIIEITLGASNDDDGDNVPTPIPTNVFEPDA